MRKKTLRSVGPDKIASRHRHQYIHVKQSIQLKTAIFYHKGNNNST